MRDIDRYERDYLDNPFEAVLIKYRHRKTLETIQRYQPTQILEVGCGIEPLHHYLDEFERLVIFEPSREFSERAKKISSARVSVINDELKDHYVAEYGGSFDFIVISSLLHELEDPLALLGCAKKFANDHCVIHINVPNANSLHRRLALRMGLIDTLGEKSERQIRYQQNHTFDLENLRELVVSANLEIISNETFFIKPFTHSQMQKLLDSGFVDPNILEGLYGLSEDLPGMGAEIVLNARIPI